MPGEKFVKSVFHTFNALHDQGLSTWVTKAFDLAHVYDNDINASVASQQNNSNHCDRYERNMYLWKIGTPTFMINSYWYPIDYTKTNSAVNAT